MSDVGGILQPVAGLRPYVAAARLFRRDHLPPLADAAVHAAREGAEAGSQRWGLGQLGRRRRCRGGEERAAGGRRVPPPSQALSAARRARAEGHPALRAARHGQDAARQSRREGVRREVLLPERLCLRRDVRRPRRRPDPEALRRGAQERARDRLHRRARRRRARLAPAAASTASTTRRSTSCSSSWTASTSRPR